MLTQIYYVIYDFESLALINFHQFSAYLITFYLLVNKIKLHKTIKLWVYIIFNVTKFKKWFYFLTIPVETTIVHLWPRILQLFHFKQQGKIHRVFDFIFGVNFVFILCMLPNQQCAVYILCKYSTADLLLHFSIVLKLANS